MHVRYVTRSTGERVVRITRSEPAVAVSTLFSEIKFKPAPCSGRFALARLLSCSLPPFSCLSLSCPSCIARVSCPRRLLAHANPVHPSFLRPFVRSFDQPRCNYIMVLCRDPSPPSEHHPLHPRPVLSLLRSSFLPTLLRPPRNRANRYPRGLSILHACLRRLNGGGGEGVNAKGLCACGRVANK